MNTPHYLLCYDITDPRRLQKAFRACSSHATPFQYSVFCVIGQTPLRQLLGKIEHIIDPHEDDIRVYRIGKPETVVTLGQPLLPEELYLL